MTEAVARWLTQLFGWMCRRHPADFRRLFADDMTSAFDRGCRQEASRGGARALWRFGIRNLSAAGVSLCAEHWQVLKRRTGRHAYAISGPAALPPGSGTPRRESAWSATARDVRLALRGLRRSPGWTAIAVLTLALGIGANSAVFSVIDAALLQPLPFPSPERLVAIHTTLRDQSWWSASPMDVREWRERSTAFDAVTFAQPDSGTLLGREGPEQVSLVRAAENFFSALGAVPDRGRLLEAGDGQSGASPVVVLTFGYWQRRFGSDPAVLGLTLDLDGLPHAIVGVLGPEFEAAFLPNAVLYVPRRDSSSDLTNRGRLLRTIGRLKSGVRLSEAQADLDRVAERVAADDPTMAGWGTRLVPLQEQIGGAVRPALLLLLGAAGFVLLVACANVAHLLLARGTARRREAAVRLALGATRSRVVRTLLAEASVLSLLGAATGLALASWCTHGLLGLGPGSVPRAGAVGLTSPVFGFTLLVWLLATLGFGLVPALQVSRLHLADEMKAAGRGLETSVGHRRLRHLLLALEIAAVLVLLSGAGLMLAGFDRLRQVDTGFEPHGKLVVRMTLPRARYADTPQIARFVDLWVDEASRIPGVEAVGAVTNLPLASAAGFTAYHLIEGRPIPPPGAEPIGGVELVSASYFAAMGMPLLAGRAFTAYDRSSSTPVAIVNDAAQRLYWPDASPVGDRLQLGRPQAGNTAPAQLYEIVGVVRGVRYSLDAEVRPRVYLPFHQAALPATSLGFVVGPSAPDPARLVPAVRAATARVDAAQPLADARPYDEVLSSSIQGQRFQTVLIGAFGLVALMLGFVGVYGVVSYHVTQHVREIGVRMAMGAGRGRVARAVVWDTLRPVLVGAGVGLVLAVVSARAMSNVTTLVGRTDFPMLVAVMALLIGVAGVAAWLPARRAAKIDPLLALRGE